jgi:hypothetical protein
MTKKITIWIKIGKIFIDQDEIKELVRQGLQTKICMFDKNNDIVVDAEYDKVKGLLASGKM